MKNTDLLYNMALASFAKQAAGLGDMIAGLYNRNNNAIDGAAPSNANAPVQAGQAAASAPQVEAPNPTTRTQTLNPLTQPGGIYQGARIATPNPAPSGWNSGGWGTQLDKQQYWGNVNAREGGAAAASNFDGINNVPQANAPYNPWRAGSTGSPSSVVDGARQPAADYQPGVATERANADLSKFEASPANRTKIFPAWQN